MMNRAGTAFALLGLTCLLAGCVDDLDSTLRFGNHGSGAACTADDDGKVWSLGTGHIEDIKRLSPRFFDHQNGASRRAALAAELKGISEVRPTTVDGADAFEFVTREAPYRIRAIRLDDKVAILATPGQCPQVKALDRCVHDRLRTEVAVQGMRTCLGPVSVPDDHIAIAIDGAEAKQTLTFGAPLFVGSRSSTLAFDIYLENSKEPAAHVQRTVGDTSKALPEEVLTLLRLGYLLPAASLWSTVTEDLKSPPVVDQLVKARVAIATRASEAASTPREVAELIKSQRAGTLPGNAEVGNAIISRVHELMATLVRAEPKPQTLFDIALYLRLIEPFKADQPDLSALDSKYGPLLHQGGYDDPKVQGSFMILVPNSNYTRELEAEDAQANQQAEANAKKQAGQMETEDAWAEVQARGDEIATLAFKIQFGRQNFAKTPHNQRGLASMEKYRAGLIRDAFCPAKRAFLQKAGQAELNRRASEHCSKEPPTDVGVGGVAKTLTTECRAAFSTGC